MHPGQVWSSADFDGINRTGHDGGCGSILAVTAQHPGDDDTWGTVDDLLAPLNAQPGHVSIDMNVGPNCSDRKDRVRNFLGGHDGLVVFAFCDGSVRNVTQDVDGQTLRRMSTMGEE